MIKKITQSELTVGQFEREINSAGENATVYLEQNLVFDLQPDGQFLIGKDCVKPIISLSKRDVVLDGQGNKIIFRCFQPPINDIALLQIGKEAIGSEIRNLSVEFIYCGKNTSRGVIAVQNHAYGAKISRCNLSMTSESQINLTVIQNDRRVDTVIDREGDNFVVEGCDIRIRCTPSDFDLPTLCCGIYNDLPNSMNITNNYLLILLNGGGEMQKAVGIFNNGKFVRITDNNIKTNGLHRQGEERAHTHTYGVYNEGDYLLFSANNCIAEWAGKAIGLFNQGLYCAFNGNKFLGTHTIHAVSVQNCGDLCTFCGNIFTATSKNARLLINTANNVVYQANILRSLYFVHECLSGCGMLFEDSEGCSAIGNQILSIRNCGIFMRNSKVTTLQNYIEEQNGNWLFRPTATEQNGDISAVIETVSTEIPKL